ncbi:MAG: HAMP domain-containing sensor histidine kinase [Phycisphaerae bacterium]|jgi:signal transduction histidine kinase
MPEDTGRTLTDAGAGPGKPYALVVLLQLHWFVRLRWIFAAGGFVVLVCERIFNPASAVQRPWALWIAVLCVAGVNCVWVVVSRLFRHQLENPEKDLRATIRSGQTYASAQIATDLLLLTCILALTGGVENPMSLFYLFHVAITGLLLRTWQAALQSAWAVVLYTTMCVGQAQGWIPYYPFLPHLGADTQHMVPQHVALVVLIVAFAVFGTLYFMDRIGKLLDRRQSQLAAINAALHKSQVAIQDLQRRRSRFMQTAAHQLKSPLAMVQTLANLIRDGILTSDEDVKSTCDKIVRRSREGIVQVTELLTLARVQDADPRRHRAARVDMGSVVTKLCRQDAPVAEEKGLEFTWQVPEGIDLSVRVHEADLNDCVGNLIENAIKYTPAGGTVRVMVFVGKAPALAPSGRRDDREYVYVIVRDTGIGIDAKGLPSKDDAGGASIFDAFRRGSNALAAGIPGTGMGLSIVREVVEQSGGRMIVYSRPGRGSSFTVLFPTFVAELDDTGVRDTRASGIVIEAENHSAHADNGAADGQPAGG